MHVLIAPDRFPGLLTAEQVATAIAAGWRRGAPHDSIALVPLSDGGSGFVEAVAAGLAGQLHATVAADPLGRDVPASILLVDEDGTRTAYVESAQVAGLHLLTAEERDPTRTSSFGVGQLLQAAVDLGAARVVVGVGDAGINDAGAGLLSALGAGPAERLARGGLALASTTDADVAGLDAVRARFAAIDLVIACDVDSPLLGLKGTSAVFAEGRGASAEQAQALEHALSHFASAIARARPPATDLLTGAPIRPERAVGSGAGGGIGYALHLLGARAVSGVEAVLHAVGFERLLSVADLVVTADRSLDWDSLGGTVVEVAAVAQTLGIPTIAIPGDSALGRREAILAGLSGVYPVIERAAMIAALLADPAGTLGDRAVRVARTWSPSRR